MKYIAVFLIWNMLLLSAIQGIANSHHETAMCCKQTTHHDCCNQPKRGADNDCSKGACNVMLSCGTCGFLIISSVSILPVITDVNSKMAQRFRMGELSDYQDNGWNPPKI